MVERAWKRKEPLYRGDSSVAVAVPEPSAGISLVAHILYLGGSGRETQFSSLSERESTARHFAGRNGRVWEADVASAESEGAKHRSRRELIGLLKPPGKGDARAAEGWELKQAQTYVEQWSEHLFDWSETDSQSISAVIGKVFK